MNDIVDVIIWFAALWALSCVLGAIIFAENKEGDYRPRKRRNKKRPSHDDDERFD